MISAVENFVLLSTIFAVVCFAIALVVRLLVKNQLSGLRTAKIISIYTWTLVLPPVLAAWIVVAALLPEWWMPEAFYAAHTAHHEMHLLGDITAKVEPTLAYMLALFAAGAGLFAAWSCWQSYVHVGQVITKLQTNAEPAASHLVARVEETAQRYGLQVGLVMSDYPFSLVWGFRRSKLVVSSGLLRTLNESELTGLLEHEAAHHQRRDNLIKLALSFCSHASLAFPLTRCLLKWRGCEVERVCDEIASSRTRAPLDIASALVKLRRQTSPTRIAASGFVAEDVSNFHLRVSRLIESPDEDISLAFTSVGRSPVPAVIGVSFVFVGSLVASTYFFPFAFHRTVESLIRLLT